MRYCAQPGCSQFVAKGRCSKHATQADIGTRGTAQQRGYTYAWHQLSERFRQQHPLCGERADGTRDAVNSRCVQRGLDTPAECVDHTVPKAHGGTDDEANLMAACFACNTWKAKTIEVHT